MVWSSMAPKWPILVIFCEMDHQKPNFSLIYGTLSDGGCWGQPILFFKKLVDETQMPKPQEYTDFFILTKKLFLVGLWGLQSISNPVERPCTLHCSLKPLWLAGDNRFHELMCLDSKCLTSSFPARALQYHFSDNSEGKNSKSPHFLSNFRKNVSCKSIL